MKIVKLILQVVGVLLLVPAVAMATLRFENRNADGPSILFPGGEMTSGDIHTGPEPDWSFTDDIETIELQLNDPMACLVTLQTPNEMPTCLASHLFDFVSGFLDVVLSQYLQTR